MDLSQLNFLELFLLSHRVNWELFKRYGIPFILLIFIVCGICYFLNNRKK